MCSTPPNWNVPAFPTAAVITSVFVREADYQANVSGLSDFRPIVVPHPTSHLPEDEIAALATSIVDDVVERLLLHPPG